LYLTCQNRAAGGFLTAEPQSHSQPPLKRESIHLSESILYYVNFPFSRESDQQSVWEGHHLNDEVVVYFNHRKEERERDKPEKGKARLPKFFAPPSSHFDGTMKETVLHLVSLIFIYIWKEGKFLVLRSKINVCIVRIFQGGKSAVLEKRSHQFKVAAGPGTIQISKEFSLPVEAQFQRSEPPKATHLWN